MRLARSLLLVVALGSAGGTALLVHQLVRSPAPSARSPGRTWWMCSSPPVRSPLARRSARNRCAGKPGHAKPSPPAACIAPRAPQQRISLSSPPRRAFRFWKASRSQPLNSCAPKTAAPWPCCLPPECAPSPCRSVRRPRPAGLFSPTTASMSSSRASAATPVRIRPRSEILLRGARVLAVGKTLNGKASALKTATLELAPSQASTLAAAQSSGEISLSLIGAGDLARSDAPSALDPVAEIRIMKFGRTVNRQTTQ